MSKAYQQYVGKIYLIGIGIFLILGCIAVVSSLGSISENNDKFYLRSLKDLADIVKISLANLEEDLKFLSTAEPILGLIRARDSRVVNSAEGNSSEQRWKVMLESLFINLAQSTKKYMQVRYIDESGNELVRVDFKEGRAYGLPAEELQNKAQRYYFTQTMKLLKEQIYISPLDLNKEKDKIEIPYQPTMRYAIPLFNQRGERRGIIIINILANHFLGSIETFSKAKGIELFLTDKNGYYLYHSKDKLKEWGGPSDLNTGYNLKQDYSSYSELLLRGESGEGRVYSKENSRFLFFRRIDYSQEAQTNQEGWILSAVVDRDIVLFPLYRAIGFTLASLLAAIFLLNVLLKYTSRRLSEAENMKDSLIQMIVHDLNNPLTVIMMSIFEIEFAGNLTEKQKADMENVFLASRELRLLVNNILDINKMEEGKIKLNYEDFNLGEIAKEVVKEMQVVAKSGDKSVFLEISDMLPDVLADRDLIKRVIANLVNNGLKFMAPGGSVWVHVSCNSDDNNVCLSVKDSGYGIPKEYLTRVFDRFFRVKSEKVIIGHGLGLTFCKMVIAAHQGRIWAESEMGKGSIFTFTLRANNYKIANVLGRRI